MKKINQKAKYYETNEWATFHNNIFTIGITDFAQTVLGKIESIELPKVGIFIKKRAELLIIESNKTSIAVESPLSGEITSINENLKTHPNWLNESPYEKGWLVKMKISNPNEWENLMSANEYKEYMKVFFNKK